MHRDDASVFETLSSPVGVLVCEARTLQYGFYTASELRKLSVVQVTSKEQRDALNRPLPGGLYDPKMGPTDHYETCTSCGLDYSLCPGHIGHIDLALPTYSPVLFQHMLTCCSKMMWSQTSVSSACILLIPSLCLPQSQG